MALPLTCPRGHQWQPEGHETSTSTPAVCPVCGLSPSDSRDRIAPTLDFQSGMQASDIVSPPPASTPAPPSLGRAGVTSSDVPTILRGPDDVSRRDIKVLSQHIPGYEILGELGRGGMGIVYKARQTSLNRIVALKMVLAGAQAEPQQLDRFRAEAEAVARLQHGNIVQIYEISEHDGCPYFSLEYVDGGTLAQKLNGAPQPPRLAAHLVRLLALAMHSAHQRGIIHRDLKPGNVLLGTPTEHVSSPDSFHAESQGALRLYGLPKITDFGLAKHLDSQSQTRTGAIIGTPSYMAPEQAEGRSHAIGPATDVYALGTILYEMLTGRPPFEGDSSLTTIRQLLTQDPIRPSQRQLKVPRDLETICLKCLEKDPARRYHSAEDLAEDLHRFLQSQPIEARPAGWWGRTVKWTRRHPTRAALIVVVSLASLVLLVMGLSYHFRLGRAVDEARRNAEENRQSLIRLHVSQGTTAMNAGDGFTALLWFTEALRLDAGPAEHEEPHRQRIAALLHGLPRLAAVWVHEDGVNGAYFSADGSRILTAGDDNKVHLWDSETGKTAAPPMSHAGPVVRAVFSADGRRIASASLDGTARVWEAATGQPLTPPLQHKAPVHWIEFSPDGRQVVTAGAGGAARVWDVATGKQLLGELAHVGEVIQAVYSPDGRRLATAGEDGLVHFWDAATRKPLPVVLLHDRAVRCLCFSPDGKHLATGSADHSARVWDVASGEPVGPRLRHRDRVTHVCFSPFGQRLLTSSEDGSARIWRVADGERLIEPLRHKSAVRCAVFSPDGCRVATAGDDNSARLWSATTGRPLSPPLRSNGTVNCIAFSPDGRRVVAASDDGTARAWGIAGRRQAIVLDEEVVFRRTADRYLRVGAADLAVARANGPSTLASRDGRLVLKIDGDTARVYDTQSGAPVTPPLPHRNRITHAAFSPDGRQVVTTSMDQTARVWDASTGAPVSRALSHASGIEYADFSPDGQRLVTASDDNTARVWEIATGELLLPPLKHDGTVVQAVFSPNGRRVGTASLDQTARVWDALMGQVLTPPLVHPWAVRRVRFSSDGHRLLTSGSAGTTWSWDLPCSTCEAGDLVGLAQLLSGSRIDEHRGIMPLKPAELRTAWLSLRQSRSDLFDFSREDLKSWHQQTAEECARGNHWEAALWHLDRLIKAEPDNWLYHARRGLARAESGRWTDAAADFAEVVQRAPDEVEARCLFALLRLQTGDLSEYRRACAALIERQAGSGDPRTAYLTAWACGLAAGSGVKGARLVELATQAVTREPEDPDYLDTLGAALVRAGDVNEAIRRLNEALALRGRRSGAREWLWLALAHQGRGQTKEARECLDKAAPALAAPMSRHDSTGAAAMPWVQRLQLDLLHREVENALKSDKSSGK
jgi:WD40 repeat protein/Flp pilus assembly protein TadD